MKKEIEAQATILYFLKEANHYIDVAHDLAMEHEWTGTMQDLAKSKSVLVGLILNIGDELGESTKPLTRQLTTIN